MPTTKYKGFDIPTKLIGTQAADTMVARLKIEKSKAAASAKAKHKAKMASNDMIFESVRESSHGSTGETNSWWVREQLNSSSAFDKPFSSSFF